MHEYLTDAILSDYVEERQAETLYPLSVLSLRETLSFNSTNLVFVGNAQLQ